MPERLPAAAWLVAGILAAGLLAVDVIVERWRSWKGTK
jgi:hypothetical protein